LVEVVGHLAVVAVVAVAVAGNSTNKKYES
jgi:hypothetical protein